MAEEAAAGVHNHLLGLAACADSDNDNAPGSAEAARLAKAAFDADWLT